MIKKAVAGNVEMNYAVFGSGEKQMVIVPGFSVKRVLGSAELVANMYASFTEDYTLYLVEVPENIPEGYTLAQMADDTAAALKSIGVEDAAVFGASMGGMVSMKMAAEYPELVGCLVVGSSMYCATDCFKAVLDDWAATLDTEDGTALAEHILEKVYSPTVYGAYGDTMVSANNDPDDEEYRRAAILIKAMREFNCESRLSAISCPVLVLGSAGDMVFGPDSSEILAAHLDCDSYIYPENYGHAVYDEAADYLDRMLTYFRENHLGK